MKCCPKILVLFDHTYTYSADSVLSEGDWRKLQAPVYDILPSTTAIFGYAIGQLTDSFSLVFIILAVRL